MSCGRLPEQDLADFAARPDAPEWLEFRAHYPGCVDCSRAVGEWTRLRAALKSLDGADSDHPGDADLLAFVERSRGMASDRRAAIARHVAGCSPCRSELAVLRRFDFAALEADSAAPLLRPSWRERLSQLLGSLAIPLPRPALALAALALLMIPVGVAVWRALPSGEAGPPPPIARSEPVRPPPPIARSEPVRLPQAATEAAPVPEEEARLAEAPPTTESAPVERLAQEPAPELAERRRAPAPPEPVQRVEPDPASELLEPAEIASLLPESPPRYHPQLALAGGSFDTVRTRSVIRGGGPRELPALHALGPEHVGATRLAAPTLYWHLAGDSPVPVELTLMAEDGIDPALTLRLEPPVAAGLHALALADHGVRLEPGRSYDWYVSLTPDADNPETQLISQLGLRYAPAAPALDEQLLAAGPSHRAHVLAEAGYWIDAFAVLSDLAAAAPRLERPGIHRAALLRQVGLESVADALSRP